MEYVPQMMTVELDYGVPRAQGSPDDPRPVRERRSQKTITEAYYWLLRQVEAEHTIDCMSYNTDGPGDHNREL